MRQNSKWLARPRSMCPHTQKTSCWCTLSHGTHSSSSSSSSFIFFLFWSHLMACGILVPWSGIEPAPSAVNTQSPNHWTAREFPHSASRRSLQTGCCTNSSTSSQPLTLFGLCKTHTTDNIIRNLSHKIECTIKSHQKFKNTKKGSPWIWVTK